MSNIHPSNLETQSEIAVKSVWKLLEPTVPDCLKMVAPGIYEARWWKPVPMMDVEIMQRSEGVNVLETINEPHDLPGGIVVRFTVV
jgi:hypothetical protein